MIWISQDVEAPKKEKEDIAKYKRRDYQMNLQKKQV
jgi:hypothetical protein